MNNVKEASVYRVFDNLKGKIPEYIGFEVEPIFCASFCEKIGSTLFKIYGDIYIHSYFDLLNKEEFDLLFTFFDEYISDNRNIIAIIYEEMNEKVPVQTKGNVIHNEGLERLVRYINEYDTSMRFAKFFRLYIDFEIPFDEQFWESFKSYILSLKGKIKESVSKKIIERLFPKISFPKTNYIHVTFEIKATVKEIF